MTTGEKIREFRKKHRYSQKQLAELIGVAQTTVSGWETGSRGTTLDDVVLIAKALGEDVTDFIGDSLGTLSDEAKNTLGVNEKLYDISMEKQIELGLYRINMGLGVEPDIELNKVECAARNELISGLRHINENLLLNQIIYVFRESDLYTKYELYKRALELKGYCPYYPAGSVDDPETEKRD